MLVESVWHEEVNKSLGLLCSFGTPASGCAYNILYALSASKNDPLKTCNGLKSLGYCHPDYPWAFQNGKMCCSCGRQNQKQVMGKRFFQKDHYFSEINYKLLIEWFFLPFLEKWSNSKVLPAIVLLSNALMQRFVEIRSLVSVVGGEILDCSNWFWVGTSNLEVESCPLISNIQSFRNGLNGHLAVCHVEMESRQEHDHALSVVQISFQATLWRQKSAMTQSVSQNHSRWLFLELLIFPGPPEFSTWGYWSSCVLQIFLRSLFFFQVPKWYWKSGLRPSSSFNK